MPDPLSDETEVLDVYTGDTLEAAMAAAVAALGPGLQVRRARKVRSGVRGLMGREVYEVLAPPGPTGARPPDVDSGDAVGKALDRLLGDADADAAEAEAAGGSGGPADTGELGDPVSGRRLFGRRRGAAPDPAATDTAPAGPAPARLAPAAGPAGPPLAAAAGPARPAPATGPVGPVPTGVSAVPESSSPARPAAPASPASLRDVPAADVGRHARVDPEPRVAPPTPAGSSTAFEVPPAIAAALAARAARLSETADLEPPPAAAPEPQVPDVDLPGVDLSPPPNADAGHYEADGGSRRGARSVRAAARAAARQDLGAGSRRTAGAAAARRPRYGARRLDEPVPHPDPAVAEHRHAVDPPADDADLSTSLAKHTDPQHTAPTAPAAVGPAARATLRDEEADLSRTALTAPHAAGPAAPIAAPPVTSRPATTRASGAASARSLGWSRSALHRLGVPAAVVAALPATDPADDLGWLTALTAAISAVVPPPGGLGPNAPVVVNGYGLEGALGVLREGCRGAVPGVLQSAGRTAPATAVELALVLRASLTDG